MTRSDDVTAATTAHRLIRPFPGSGGLAATERDRDAGVARETNARRLGITLDGEHAHSAALQLLREPETDLAEADEHDVARAGAASAPNSVVRRAARRARAQP